MITLYVEFRYYVAVLVGHSTVLSALPPIPFLSASSPHCNLLISKGSTHASIPISMINCRRLQPPTNQRQALTLSLLLLSCAIPHHCAGSGVSEMDSWL